VAQSATKRPPLACEITAHSVLAAASAAGSVTGVAARTLPDGTLSPNMVNANVQRPDVLRTAIQEALSAVDGGRHDVSVVLPDSVIRVMLLDFETLPERQQEAAPLIRFRLKKLLPFDAEKAAVSYQMQRAAGAGVQVIAAVAQASVLEEYEAAVRDAGFQPGVVLPSVLAALGPVDGSVPTLVVKAEPATTAVAIVDQNELRLVRTIESVTPTAATPGRLAEDIYPSLVFFQDTYSAQVQRIALGGTAATDALHAALEQQTGLRVEELLDSAMISAASVSSAPRTAFAGAVGALLMQ
jgi:type IV pilus assembly protein PilM